MIETRVSYQIKWGDPRTGTYKRTSSEQALVISPPPEPPSNPSPYYVYDWPFYGFNHLKNQPNYTLTTVLAQSTIQWTPITYLEVKTSRNSAVWLGSKGARMPGLVLTRDGSVMSRPIEPRFRLPRLLKYSKPSQPGRPKSPPRPTIKHRESLEAFKNRLVTWTASEERRLRSLVSYLDRKFLARMKRYAEAAQINQARMVVAKQTFERRLAKYKQRVVWYDAAVERSKRPHYSRFMCYAHPFAEIENPYGFIKLTATGDLTQQKYVSSFLAPNNVDKLFNDYWRDLYVRGQVGHWNYAWIRPTNGTLFSTSTTPLPSDSTPALIKELGEATRVRILKALEPNIQSQERKLLRKIFSKLKNQVVHVGNLLAERKQTLEMLTSAYKRLYQLIKLKRNIFKTAVTYLTHPKQIANDVLAFKFGAEPLIEDIISAVKFLSEDSDEFVVTVRTNLKNDISFNTDGISFKGTLEMSYVVKCTNVNKVTHELSRFGLINPAEIAWEVLPWSFVIDWFLPVGAWISDLTSDVGLEFKAGTRKVKLVGDFQIGAPTDGSSVGSPLQDSPLKTLQGSFEGEVVDRIVLTTFPEQLLPAFKNPWSWSHGIESVALIIQRIKSLR